ncbi:MAG: hypothetical protein O7I42_12970 [Alphaproteobacteria bacterium]|nr:hypothetical protein [Alphaproteobacteria bacterium]
MAEIKIVVVETQEAADNAANTLLAEGFTLTPPEIIDVLVYNANAVGGLTDMKLEKWVVEGRKP